jgi:hypothetical protein
MWLLPFAAAAEDPRLVLIRPRWGVFSSVHGRIQRRQQRRWAAQDQAAAAAAPSPPPPAQYAAPAQPQPHAEPATQQPTGTNDRLAQLKQLGELLSAGVLTQAEFEQEKARILNG